MVPHFGPSQFPTLKFFPDFILPVLGIRRKVLHGCKCIPVIQMVLVQYLPKNHFKEAIISISCSSIMLWYNNNNSVISNIPALHIEEIHIFLLENMIS
jgi:hypothetical protein